MLYCDISLRSMSSLKERHDQTLKRIRALRNTIKDYELPLAHLKKYECGPRSWTTFSAEIICALYVPTFMKKFIIMHDWDNLEFDVLNLIKNKTIEDVLYESNTVPSKVSIDILLDECKSNKAGLRYKRENRIEIDGQEYVRIELWKPFLPWYGVCFKMGIRSKKKCFVYLEEVYYANIFKQRIFEMIKDRKFVMSMGGKLYEVVHDEKNKRPVIKDFSNNESRINIEDEYDSSNIPFDNIPQNKIDGPSPTSFMYSQAI